MPAVLKTAEPQGSVSSNLTLSANNKRPVGKVVNTSACHAEEHRFDPGTGRQYNAGMV